MYRQSTSIHTYTYIHIYTFSFRLSSSSSVSASGTPARSQSHLHRMRVYADMSIVLWYERVMIGGLCPRRATSYIRTYAKHTDPGLAPAPVERHHAPGGPWP